MKKINALLAILGLVFLVMFNSLFFILGEYRPLSVWVSYGFIHLAYILMQATPFLIGTDKAVIFSIPSHYVAASYFFAEFIIGSIFVLAAPESYKIALSVQICVTGCYAVLVLANMIVHEHKAHTASQEQAEPVQEPERAEEAEEEIQ